MSKNRLLFVSGAIAAALAVGGCVSKGDFEKLQAERDGLDQKVKELETQRAGLEQQKTALERQQGDLRSEVVTLEKQRAQLEMQNRQTQAQYDSLARNLNDEVQKGQIQLRQYKDMKLRREIERDR